MKDSNAEFNYFFRGAYVEFADSFVAAFDNIGYKAKRLWRRIALNDDNFVKHMTAAIFYTIAICILAPVATIATLAFSLIHLVFLVIMTILTFLLLVVVWSFNSGYYAIKKISTSCPACQSKHKIPTFVCACGAEHPSLQPGFRGIFHRKCTGCTRKIPTMFVSEKRKVDGYWKCPVCGNTLSGAMHQDVTIILVGGASSGKSCFINRAMSEISKEAYSLGLRYTYIKNDLTHIDYQNATTSMDAGKLPAKTNERRLQYYQFYLAPPKEKVKPLISICDVAGETYESITEMHSQLGFSNARAFLVVVDPLSIHEFNREVRGKIANVNQYNASVDSINEVLSEVITLQIENGANNSNQSNISVAVVFTKCDLPGLDEMIGDSAVSDYMSKHKEVKNKYEAKNILCKQFLTKYHESNFVNMLNDNFKDVQFFTSSALGHVANGTKFKPDGVSDPILWLVDKECASIDLKKKWGMHLKRK